MHKFFSVYSLYITSSYHEDKGRGVCLVLGWCKMARRCPYSVEFGCLVLFFSLYMYNFDYILYQYMTGSALLLAALKKEKEEYSNARKKHSRES